MGQDQSGKHSYSNCSSRKWKGGEQEPQMLRSSVAQRGHESGTAAPDAPANKQRAQTAQRLLRENIGATLVPAPTEQLQDAEQGQSENNSGEQAGQCDTAARQANQRTGEQEQEGGDEGQPNSCNLAGGGQVPSQAQFTQELGVGRPLIALAQSHSPPYRGSRINQARKIAHYSGGALLRANCHAGWAHLGARGAESCTTRH